MYSTKTFVIPVIIFTLVYNVPKFFELSIEYEPTEEGVFERFVSANHPNATDDALFNDANVSASLRESFIDGFDWNNYTGSYQVNLKPTELRLDRIYIRVYILWMNLILQILGPFLVLIVLNIRVYKRIIEFEQTLVNGDQLRVCFTRPNNQSTTTAKSGGGGSSGGGGGGGHRDSNISRNGGGGERSGGTTPNRISGSTRSKRQERER